MTIIFIPNHCQAHFAKGSEEKLYSYLYSRIPPRSNNHLLSLLLTSFYCIHCLKNLFSKYKIVQLLAFAFLKQTFWLIQYNRNISWASFSFLAQEEIKSFQKKEYGYSQIEELQGQIFTGRLQVGPTLPPILPPPPVQLQGWERVMGWGSGSGKHQY